MKNLQLLFCAVVLNFTYATTNAQVDIANASESVIKIAKHNVNKWKTKLTLSVNQTKMMTERITEFEMKKNAIYKSDTDMEAKNVELTTLQAELQEKMHEIMTPEQYDMYIADIKEISGN